MRAKFTSAPFVRGKNSVPWMMTSMLIALAPLIAMAVYYYGLRALMVTVISGFSCYLLDMVCMLLVNRRVEPLDLSGLVTGITMAMLMPASIPYYIPVIGAFVAIVVAKWPFGGFGKNPFNPAAVGIAFLSITYSKLMFYYPIPFTKLGLESEISTTLVQSTAAVLKLEGIPNFGKMEMILGKFPGPMGATNILVVATCLLLLLALGYVSWHIPVTMLATMGAYAYLFPRVMSSRIGSAFYELVSGGIVFVAVFIAGDCVTAPKTKPAKIIYAILVGLVTMWFSRYGAFEAGACFAVIILNSVSSFLDRACAYLYYHHTQFKGHPLALVKAYANQVPLRMGTSRSAQKKPDSSEKQTKQVDETTKPKQEGQN